MLDSYIPEIFLKSVGLSFALRSYDTGLRLLIVTVLKLLMRMFPASWLQHAVIDVILEIYLEGLADK